MEENDQTIESDDETSGIDAPSEATQWAQEADDDGEPSELTDVDLEELADVDDEPADDD